MPELPEAETIAGQLRQSVLGKKVQKVRVHFPSRIRVPEHLPGRIAAVSRRGKALLIHFPQGALLVRLGMTGQFSIHKKLPPAGEGTPERHVLAALELDDGTVLCYRDARRFGSIKFHSPQELQRELARFGAEPLEISGREFQKCLLRKGRSMIKPALMDQAVIAGVGNIYAQESLYRAGILPQRRIETISAGEMQLLHRELQKTLRQAIHCNGTTVLSYQHMGGGGSFGKFLKVYDKDQCPRSHPLEKSYLGSRGTWFCRKCQK